MIKRSTSRKLSQSILMKGVAALLALAAVGVAVPTQALVPPAITQQGRILDSEGNAVDGTVTIVFTLYDDPSAAEESNILWEESQDITLDEGYFSTRLGELGANPFPGDAFDGSVRYLGVKVGGDDEMTPRQEIASVPYALVANDAVGDINPTSVSVNGTEVINEDGDWVGNAVDRDLTGLLTRVVGAEQANVRKDLEPTGATVSCAGGQVLTGGGCNVEVSDNIDDDEDGIYPETYMKASYPSSATTWQCYCAGDDNCNLTAYAICASP